MQAIPHFDTAERRRRIGIRHRLSRPGPDAVEVAGALVGIHASDPASVYLAARARIPAFRREMLAAALYEQRSLLRVLGMRRTMFVMPAGLAAIVQSAVTRRLAPAERRRLIEMLRAARVDRDPEAWLDRVEAETVRTLERLGTATASELGAHVPALRTKIPVGEGTRWAGTVGVSTRLLFLLATEARVVRGEPRGGWLSSLYRWAPMDAWVEGDLEDWPAERAEAELVRRWLGSFGPGTFEDIRWWTGWTTATTRRALATAGAVAVTIGGSRADADRDGYALAGDLEPTPDTAPWVALLPALDSTTMGWKERRFFLADHAPRLFDRNGNAGPTIWLAGRVIGGWAQRAGGEVVHRLLEDVGRDAAEQVAAEAARLEAWLGAARVIPRFRTPLEVELSR